MSSPPWEWLEALGATLEHGSLSGASRALQVAQPTVRRRVEALEAARGAPLFVRGPNGLVATDAAVALRPLLRAMASNARAVARSSSERDELRGTVRVTAPTVMGTHVLPPMLRQVRAGAPELHIELVTSDAVDDLVRRDADIAVRTLPSTQPALVARRVGDVPIGIAASPVYLEGRYAPQRLEDLHAHDWVLDDRLAIVRRGLAHLGLDVDRVIGVLRTDDSVAQLAAIRAGLGIGPCQARLVEPLGLVRLLPGLEVAMPLWVVVHEDLRGVTRIRHVFDGLVAGFERYVAPVGA